MASRTEPMPLSLRQRPEPYRLRSRESWRIHLPTATISMSVIAPTISKYIWPHRFIGVAERRRSPAGGRAARAPGPVHCEVGRAGGDLDDMRRVSDSASRWTEPDR